MECCQISLKRRRALGLLRHLKISLWPKKFRSRKSNAIKNYLPPANPLIPCLISASCSA